MGMYTELIFSATLDGNLPEQIIQTIRYMCNGKNKPEALPKHELFETEGWDCLFTMSSYYFVDTVTPIFRYDEIAKDWRLTTRANLKNYHSEIEKFLDWIKPYITGGCGWRNYYAIVCYEEQGEPTIYYLDDDGPAEEE